ncbi:DDB1- and CUL4-associated factor 17 [Halotydeus destructor]|nr:DDB1- and CUL4-associated factor 17 [Halotydeus destructor]
MKLIKKSVVKLPNYSGDGQYKRDTIRLGAEFKTKNVTRLLAFEQLGFNCRHRAIFALLRDQDVTYSIAYVETSKQEINVEEDKIFKNEYKICMSLFGNKGKPGQIWNWHLKNADFLKNLKLGKVSETLILPPQNLATYDKDNKCTQVPYVLYLIDNSIYRLNPYTGEVMNHIYLSPKKEDVSYSYLRFDAQSQLVVASSSPYSKNGLHQRFALFKISPLRFYIMFDISATIAPHFKKAKVQGGALHIHYNDKKIGDQVKVYSIPRLLQLCPPSCKCDIGDECHRHGPLGVHPHGIMPNVALDLRCRSILVVSATKIIAIDGKPYHVIFKNLDKDKFIVQQLYSKNSQILYDRDPKSRQTIQFIPDQTNRLLLRKENSVEIHAIKPRKNIDDNLKNLSISSDYWWNQKAKEEIVMNFASSPVKRESLFSRRQVAQNKSYASQEPTVYQLCIDKDLSIIAILIRDVLNRKRHDGAVALIDLRTGILINKIPLQLTLESSKEYRMHYCAEYIAICEDPAESGEAKKLHVYRISRKQVQAEIVKSKQSSKYLLT